MQRSILNPIEDQRRSIVKIVNGWKVLTIFAKSTVLDVWLGSEYASDWSSLYDKAFVFQKSKL